VKRVRVWLASPGLPRYVLLGFGVALLLTFHAWSLMRFPAPFVDEAWYASRSWGLITTHKAFGVLDAGVFDRFPGYWTYFQWLPVWLQSLVVRLAGGPSLPGLRALSLGFGMILAAAVYSIGSSIGGRRLGTLAATLLLISQPFLYSAHMARYDVMAAACGYGAIAIVLRNRARRFIPGVCAGLLVGLAFEIHPLSSVFVPPLAALLLLEDGRAVLKDRAAWGIFVGGAAGLLLYLLLHVVPYPATYAALTGLVYGPTHTPPIASWDLSILLTGLVDELGLLFFVYLFGLLAVLIAIVRLYFNRGKATRALLVLALAMILSHALLVRNKFFYYAILATPSIDLLLAAFLIEETRAVRGGLRRRWIGLAMACLALGASVGLYVLPLRTDQYRVYLQAQSRINATIRPGDVMMGSQTYWFGLRDHTYYSWEQLVYYRRYAPGSSLEAAMAEFAPDVFVLDGHIREYLTEGSEGEAALYSGLLALSRPDLEQLLLRRGALVDEFDAGSYGRIQIYRMTWSESAAKSGLAPAHSESVQGEMTWTSPVQMEHLPWRATEN